MFKLIRSSGWNQKAAQANFLQGFDTFYFHAVESFDEFVREYTIPFLIRLFRFPLTLCAFLYSGNGFFRCMLA